MNTPKIYYRVEVNPNNIGTKLETPFSLNPQRVDVANNAKVWQTLSLLVDISLANNLTLFNVCSAAVEQKLIIANYLPGVWEVLMEKARPTNIPYRRTDCAFFFINEEDAIRFRATYPGMQLSKLCKVEVIKEQFSMVCDMNWLDAIDENTVTAQQAIDVFLHYWAGEMTNKPIKEVLFAGSYQLMLKK